MFVIYLCLGTILKQTIMDCSVGQNGTGRDTLSSFKKSSFYGKYLGQNETKMNKRE